MHTVLSSPSEEVVIGHDRPFCIIGERINPTGRSAFAAALRNGDLSLIEQDVARQVAAGAHVLDVNAGVPLTDEAALLTDVIKLVQSLTGKPICIDSSVVPALAAALEVYEGKPLVNSVTGEDDRLEEIMPLVKRHGAAVIALANDASGIPATADERLAVVEKILSAADSYGIPHEDVIIDPLAMTVGADPTAVTVTLETIAAIRAKHGLNMCLGASNVSFGLPRRHALGAAFLPMAMASGLTSAIMNALSEEITTAVRAGDLLLGNDEWAMNWIAAYRSAAHDNLHSSSSTPTKSP